LRGERVREFARHVYQGKPWARAREYIIQRDDGLCARCGNPGDTVHHIIWLTPENVDDPAIVYSENNLELLCQDCHNKEHHANAATAEGLMFDAEGNLVPA